MGSRIHLLGTALCIRWIASLSLSCFAFGQSPTTFQLASIRVTGLSRFDATQVISASGLRSNQSISVQDIEAVVQKLARSGFFERVSYRYSHNAGKMDLEFQVVETKNLLPCIFDNFIWLSDSEILDALRARMPMFRGSIPEVGSALQEVTQIVQGFLGARNISGTVTALLNQQKQESEPLQFLFQVSGINLPIHKLEFPGTKAVSEAELQEKAKPLLGQQYSRTFARKFARQTLAPLFRKKGHLRIQFKEPALRIKTGSASESGITLVLEPDEGSAYTWNGAVWTGDSGLSPENLDRMLRLKAGAIADGSLIDEGLAAVREQLGRSGYIEARIKEFPEFSDPDRTVRFMFQVEAGAQYSMGSVIFKGVPEPVAKRLGSLWRLRSGDIFDASYADEFKKTDAKDEIARIRPRQIITTLTADREKRIANVIMEFE